MRAIEGILTAMVTPFDERGEIDWPAVRRLARYLVDNGSDGLVVAGTTGESPTLRESEHLALLGCVRDEVGDEVTIVVGTGSNDTRHAVELTHDALGGGADAALVVAPYYNKPNPAGLLAHFGAVAEVGLPVIVYNIPSRVVINMEPELLAELAELEMVVALKEANPAQLQPTPGMALLAGDDTSLLPVLEAGGAGGILVASHLVGPRMAELVTAARAGDLEQARQIDAELAPVYDAMGVTVNPIPVKTALALRGQIGPTMRLPMLPADEAQRAALRDALDRFGLLEAVA